MSRTGEPGSPYVVGERELALFNLGGAFYAVDNACPHQGGPLCEGWIDGKSMTCPWGSPGPSTFGPSEIPNDPVRPRPSSTLRVEGDEIMIGRTPRPGGVAPPPTGSVSRSVTEAGGPTRSTLVR